MEIIIILRFKQTHRPTSFLCFFNLSKFSSYYNTHTHTPHDQSSTHICYTISHLYGSQVIFFHCWSSKHAILHLSTSLYNTPWNRESLCMINPLPRGPINTLEVTWDLCHSSPKPLMSTLYQYTPKYNSPYFFLTEESHSLQFFQLWDHGLQDLVHHLSHLVLHVVEGVSNLVGVVNVCERILRSAIIARLVPKSRHLHSFASSVVSTRKSLPSSTFDCKCISSFKKTYWIDRIILLLCPYSGVFGPTTFISSLPISLSYHPILLFHLVLFE